MVSGWLRGRSVLDPSGLGHGSIDDDGLFRTGCGAASCEKRKKGEHQDQTSRKRLKTLENVLQKRRRPLESDILADFVLQVIHFQMLADPPRHTRSKSANERVDECKTEKYCLQAWCFGRLSRLTKGIVTTFWGSSAR